MSCDPGFKTKRHITCDDTYFPAVTVVCDKILRETINRCVIFSSSYENNFAVIKIYKYGNVIVAFLLVSSMPSFVTSE